MDPINMFDIFGDGKTQQVVDIKSQITAWTLFRACDKNSKDVELIDNSNIIFDITGADSLIANNVASVVDFNNYDLTVTTVGNKRYMRISDKKYARTEPGAVPADICNTLRDVEANITNLSAKALAKTKKVHDRAIR